MIMNMLGPMKRKQSSKKVLAQPQIVSDLLWEALNYGPGTYLTVFCKCQFHVHDHGEQDLASGGTHRISYVYKRRCGDRYTGE